MSMGAHACTGMQHTLPPCVAHRQAVDVATGTKAKDRLLQTIVDPQTAEVTYVWSRVSFTIGCTMHVNHNLTQTGAPTQG